ncbi:hypothetical protein [Streptomyces sp. NPDC048142]|uniref:hypothetical protein n=1 Tax=Streptomyces sp. NPDC048142 TaxID=3365501 RepID=UPI003720E77A
MVAVTAGVSSALVSGLAYCSVISACLEVFDLVRACVRTAEMPRWCAIQHGQAPYRGACLVRRVEFTRLRGDRADAMDETDRASRRWVRPVYVDMTLCAAEVGKAAEPRRGWPRPR